jgi:hypothetical protein
MSEAVGTCRFSPNLLYTHADITSHHDLYNLGARVDHRGVDENRQVHKHTLLLKERSLFQ